MRPSDLAGILGQISFAARRLRRAPAFTLSAILLLGVGAGLGIPLFNLINVFLLKPATAGRDYVRVVVNDYAGYVIDAAEVASVMATPPTTFEALLGSGVARTTAVVDGISLRASIEGISGPYFAEFPMVPLLGRVLTHDDERSGRNVAIISERLWKVAFAGRTDAIGTSAVLAGQRVTIVGVAPDGYEGAPISHGWYGLSRRDAWVPPHVVPPRDLFSRLTPGVTIEQAAAEVAARSLPRGETGRSRVLGVHRGLGAEFGNLHVSGRTYSTILVMLGLGIAISLIATGSFALLLFARLLSSQADLSIRLALGATVRDLAHLLTFEASLLALGATAVALLVGTQLTSVFVSQLSYASGLAVDPDLSLDWRLVAYTALTTFGAVGMVIARLVWNLRALEALGSMVATSGVGGSTQRTSGETSRLVIAQTAVSAGLLLVAVMLGRTILAGVDPSHGLDVDRSAVAWLDHTILPDAPAEAGAILHRAIDAARTVPGVVGAAAVTSLLASNSSFGVSSGASAAPIHVRAHYVTASAFDVLRRPIVRGRTFTPEEDRTGADVAIVSATAAARLWPNADIVGRRLWRRQSDGSSRSFVVIGVTTDIPPTSGERLEPRDIYLPVAHRPSWQSVGIVARASDDGVQLAARVRDAYRAQLPDTGFLHVRSMRQDLDDRLSAASFWARTYGVLGLLVAIVAMGGLYGLSAHLAILRRREIGIRKALGATTTMLCRMLHHEHSRMLARGVGIGCAGGLFLASLLLRYFRTLQLWDPASLVLVAGTLYLAGLIGALAPFVGTMRDATVSLKD